MRKSSFSYRLLNYRRENVSRCLKQPPLRERAERTGTKKEEEEKEEGCAEAFARKI